MFIEKKTFVVLSFAAMATLVLTVFSFFACQDNKPKEATQTVVTETQAAVKTDTTRHVHVFACPMHPDITGKEGDKCPKCGMALVHKD